jgi:regulator-associated protein of mTOR
MRCSCVGRFHYDSALRPILPLSGRARPGIHEYLVLQELPFELIFPLCLVQSCQVDLVKDGGHVYFIQFLKSPDSHPEQRAMAAFVLAVIVDGHPRGQEACIYASPGLIGICLSHIQESTNAPEGQPEPLLLQWLCLCLGKLWDGSSDGLTLAFQDNAPAILGKVLSEPQPEVC